MTSRNAPRMLLIETSGDVGHVGLAQGSALLQEALLDRVRRHTRDLIPECKLLCTEQSWKPTDLDGIAVSIGPGSYTGLRVGVMTAKTLAFALNKPLLAIPTFEIIARQAVVAHPDLSSLMVIADGQQDKVYVQEYSKFSPVSSLTIVHGEAWRSSLPAGTVLTGPGLRQQVNLLPPTMQLMNESIWDPQLFAFIALMNEYYHDHKFSDYMVLEPIYLRASSAEEQWLAQGK